MTSTTQAYRAHNHQHCIEDALVKAQALCNRRGARFTKLREQVFKLVWHSHKPLGAYTILEKLAENSGHSRPAPPTVYRTLEFLQQQGLVHRIASLNAFIGCDDPQHPHSCQFLICHRCDTTVELGNRTLPESILEEAESTGFVTESALIEVIGLCPNCQHREKYPCE